MKKTGKKSGSTSLVKYGDFTEEDAAEEMDELNKSGGSGIVLKLEQGKTVLRFLPPLPGKKWKRVTYVHYIDVPGADRVSFVCPRMEKKQFCIVCKREQELRATGNPKDEKKAMSIMAKRQCFANVINRKAPEDGPRVLRFGKMIEKQLIEMRQDEDLGGNFIDPVNGIDVAIITKGAKMNTEYKVVAANKARVLPLSEDATEMNDWIQSQHNLERFAKVPTADEIEAMLRGEKVERKNRDEDDEEDEDTDRTSRSRGRGRDEDEDEEDEAPPRTSSKPSKPVKKPKRTVDEEIEDAVIVLDEDDED